MRHLRLISVTALISAVALLIPTGGLAEASHETRITDFSHRDARDRLHRQRARHSERDGALVETFVTDAAGGVHSYQIVAYVNVVGTGEQTGKSYRFVGTDLAVTYGEPGSSEFLVRTTTGLINYRLIVQGADNNLEIFAVGHATITPSGEITSFQFNTMECRGNRSHHGLARLPRQVVCPALNFAGMQGAQRDVAVDRAA